MKHLCVFLGLLVAAGCGAEAPSAKRGTERWRYDPEIDPTLT
jgi:hypothetical protein